jgi:2-keto-4-pentenoate hydratase
MDPVQEIKQEWCNAIWKAVRENRPIEPPSSSLGALTIDQAYAVQAMIMAKKKQAGERIIGWKVGATSRAVLEQLRSVTDEPIFGCMTSSSIQNSLLGIKAADFCRLGFEGEIAFIMGKPLKGPGITNGDVMTATEGITASVELVDWRIKGKGGNIADTIADNSGHGGIIPGNVVKPLEGLDLRYEGVVCHKNGRLLASACGCEAMGNPVNVVTWLANKLARFDLGIGPGDIITTGSLTRFFHLEPGDVVDVSYTHLGSIQFYVTE